MKRKKSVVVLILVLGILAFGAYRFSRFAYETAPYTVVTQNGDFEIRDYPDLVVVTTPMKTNSWKSSDSFQRLFGYISGENESAKKISMTTPVFTRQDGSKRSMSFVVSQELAKQGAPSAVNDQVQVETIPGGHFAVYRFSGSWSPERFEQGKQILAQWLKDKGLEPIGEPVIAGYDPPFTPNFLRRNEVLVRVRKESISASR